MGNVFAKALWDQRRGICGWAVGISAVGVLYALFYPTMNMPALAEYMRNLPQQMFEAMGGGDFSTPAGYLGSTTYGILGPILFLVFGAAMGSRAIAGDEEAGRLDVLLAHPVSRTRFLVERGGAMFVALGIAGTALFAVMAVIAGPAEFGSIGLANLAAASVHIVLLGSFFGALALAVGAATGRRGWAAGAVAVVGVLTYFTNTLGPSIDWLSWTRDVSPFHYYSGGQPLSNGLQPGDAAVLAVVTLVLVASAALAFRRRDVAV
jgi:ABC-2 type transport system permease protein